MRILFERTGGFANIRFSGSFDLDNLPVDVSKEISELVEQANIQDLPQQILDSSPIPDQFNYSLTVITKSWQRNIQTGDRSAPESLRPLLQKLTELTRTQARKK